MVQLICILCPLLFGYWFRQLPIKMIILNKILQILVVFILFIMGYNFGSMPDFISNILKTARIVTVVTLCLLFSNMLFISIYTKIKSQLRLTTYNNKSPMKFIKYIFASFNYLIYLVLGIFAGYFLKIPLIHIEFIINIVLFVLLFIIGFQLRYGNVSLKTILFNKTGIIIALLIVMSSMVAGIIAAIILNLDINTGLVLSSGFGWYTLSGILAGQLINSQIGSASFFIDFLREIIAIVLIPSLGRIMPIFCIGYSGATALDFTLPIIKINLGDEFASLGITSGLILTILVPILMPFEYAWHII